MPHYHCCWGKCRSDSRKPEDGVSFIPFPKPKTDMVRAKRWAHLCGRKGFTTKSITRHTFICTKHFPCNISNADKEIEPHNAAGTGVRVWNERKSPVKRKVSSPASSGPASSAPAPASSEAAPVPTPASERAEPDDEVNPRQMRTYRKKPRLARESDTESCGSDTDTASADSWDAMGLHRFVKIYKECHL
jgi:hypothetical protein